MFPGFERIIEERILQAQQRGDFDNLEGAGKPLNFEENHTIPEDLRLAYKILKNAGCLPPELELKKEIRQTEDLLKGMEETAEKYRILKKLNYLILKLNSMRPSCAVTEIPQYYLANLTERITPNSKTDRSE